VNEFILPIKNGKAINLKTLEIRDRTINDYFSYELDVNYISKKTKHADKFFRELMKDDLEKMKVVQMMLGYSITSNIDAKCYFILLGGGDNGKSALMRVVQTIFKPLFTVLQKSLLFEENKMKSELGPYLAILAGKRFGIYNEPSSNLEMNEAVVKSITGGDEIVAKRLYQDPFTFTPKIKMWILTNKFIKFDVASQAMVQRTKIISMDAEFSDKPTKGQYKKDPQFIEDLQTTYRDEVFSFIANGAYMYYKRKQIREKPGCGGSPFGEDECTSMINYTNKYIDDSDNVKAFLNDRCIIDETSKCKIMPKELFIAFTDYCLEHDITIINREVFYSKLLLKKLSPSKINGYFYYKHIKLITTDEEEEIKVSDLDVIDDIPVTEIVKKSIKKLSVKKSIKKLIIEIPDEVDSGSDDEDDSGSDDEDDTEITIKNSGKNLEDYLDLK